MGQVELDIGVVASSTYDEDKYLCVGTDVPGRGAQGSPSREVLAPYGFMGRPLDPEKDAAGTVGAGCSALICFVGDERMVLPVGDPRVTPFLPPVRKGGSMQYGGTGETHSLVAIEGEDPNGSQRSGSIMALAAYDKDGEKRALGLSMNVRTAGKEEAAFVHGDGHGLALGSDGAVTMHNEDFGAFVSCHKEGVTIAGRAKLQGSLTVGGPAADSVVLLKPLFTYLMALEAKLAASLVGPVPVSIATIESTLGSKVLKA